jgi:hypothetical protein
MARPVKYQDYNSENLSVPAVTPPKAVNAENADYRKAFPRYAKNIGVHDVRVVRVDLSKLKPSNNTFNTPSENKILLIIDPEENAELIRALSTMMYDVLDIVSEDKNITDYFGSQQAKKKAFKYNRNENIFETSIKTSFRDDEKTADEREQDGLRPLIQHWTDFNDRIRVLRPDPNRPSSCIPVPSEFVHRSSFKANIILQLRHFFVNKSMMSFRWEVHTMILASAPVALDTQGGLELDEDMMANFSAQFADDLKQLDDVITRRQVETMSTEDTLPFSFD